MISLDKLSKMELLAFKNALRLHFDTIKLFNLKSYPSAYFLSLIALEEYGKAEALGHYVFSVNTGDARDLNFEKEWINHIHSNHKSKQIWYLHNRGPFYKKYQRHELFQSKFIKDILDGKVESMKQNSVYVGLIKKNGKINMDGRLNDPSKIKKGTVMRQITAFNDNIIDWTMGLYIGRYGHDNEDIRRILTRKLAKKLSELWPIKDTKTKKLLERYMKQQIPSK